MLTAAAEVLPQDGPAGCCQHGADLRAASGPPAGLRSSGRQSWVSREMRRTISRLIVCSIGPRAGGRHMALYAFDGTWNEAKTDDDPQFRNTNVFRFFEAYRRRS